MKRKANRPPFRSARGTIRVHPREFIFQDRATGKTRFSVKAARDGNMPLDQTCSLLAMHCVLHSQSLADFRIMVSVGDELLHRLTSRAQKLIDSCSNALTPIRISIRQQQVLRGMFQNMRNKEIAALMNISERTIKFHVSALLQKFNVADRVSLLQKVDELLSSQGITPMRAPADFRQALPPAARPEACVLKPALVRVGAGERRAGR